MNTNRTTQISSKYIKPELNFFDKNEENKY